MDKLSVHAKKTFLSQRLIAWVCCLCAIGTAAKAYANNDPTFTVSAPENIEINKQFRLTFIVSFPEKPATHKYKTLDISGLFLHLLFPHWWHCFWWGLVTP